MTIDQLIAELQRLKEEGVSGNTEVVLEVSKRAHEDAPELLNIVYTNNLYPQVILMA